MEIAIPLERFRSTFRAGGFQSISVTASGGEFFVTAEPRTGGRVTLATTHGKKLRAFRNPSKAIEILHRIGAHKVEVDLSAWSPDQAALRKRPDTAARQRRAHEAAAHDAWFRSEVELALLESNDPQAEWDTQEEVKKQSAIKRAGWLAGVKSDEASMAEKTKS